jgi:hypothetical protein
LLLTAMTQIARLLTAGGGQIPQPPPDVVIQPEPEDGSPRVPDEIRPLDPQEIEPAADPPDTPPKPGRPG